jgi:UDP-hydrolysing UDP-N-acetyl-D-glucosamine 2-epimerase
VTNDDARRRVLAMGEDPKYVFNTGSLDVEVASSVTSTLANDVLNGYGVGHEIDLARPFVLVIQHPVTTELDNRRHLEETLRAVSSLDLPAIWIWPNADAGTGEMADSLRHFREHAGSAAGKMRFITDVPVGEFIALLKTAACLIGNSSAGIKEGSFLGTPVVDIGARQQGRLRAGNVMHVGYDSDVIVNAARRQIAHGRYASSPVYYRPGASQAMVDVLADVELYTQKRFCEAASGDDLG